MKSTKMAYVSVRLIRSYRCIIFPFRMFPQLLDCQATDTSQGSSNQTNRGHRYRKAINHQGVEICSQMALTPCCFWSLCARIQWQAPYLVLLPIQKCERISRAHNMLYGACRLGLITHYLLGSSLTCEVCDYSMIRFVRFFAV